MTARIRRLRGVSWEWRRDAPVEGTGREAGVIAQEVQSVFPELVKRLPHGYLGVDYRGLTARIAAAVVELRARFESLEAPAATGELSDAGAKRDLGPVEEALERLRSGEDLKRADQTALVGALIEAVKELDARIAALERERVPDSDREREG